MRQPTFSIIIATRNRPQPLQRCVNALLELDGDTTPFEIIIVNDGGEPLGLNCADEHCRTRPITVINRPPRGISASRNLGAAHATGEWLAITDDDCTPARDWLRQFANHISAQDDVALGGNVLNGLVNDLYATASQTLFGFLYQYYHSGRYQSVHPPFFTGNNLAVSRARFFEVGGFDERLYAGEDRDFCARWQERGYRLRYVPAACITHWRSLTFRSFIRQHWYYGRGNFLFQQHRTQRGFKGFRLEPLRFYADLLRYPFTLEARRRASHLAFLLTLAQLCNLYGFVTQSLSHDRAF